MDPDEKPRGTLNRAAWKLVAAGSIGVSFCFLTALLAQGGLFTSDPGLPGHPDGITTLALVLAILAFLVQILVFVIQTYSASSTVRRSEELNAETAETLSKIESNSAATQRVLFSQFDRLLDYVVGEGVTQTGAETNDGDDTEDGDEGAEVVDTGEERPATVADIARLIESSNRPGVRPSFEGLQRLTKPSVEDEQIRSYLRSYPPERHEAEVAVQELLTLPAIALSMLTRLGSLEIRQRRMGQRVGVKSKSPNPGSQILLDNGLAREDNERLFLTESGRRLARILPIGKPSENRPDWFLEVIAPLSDERG